jgi:hypothetical protein
MERGPTLPLSEDRFDPPLVHAESGMADARCRTDVDDLGHVVGNELHVVHEPEDEARELNVQVSAAFRDDLRSRQGCDDASETGPCVSCRASVGKGRYPVPLVGSLDGSAVQARRVREEPSDLGAKAIGPCAGISDRKDRGQRQMQRSVGSEHRSSLCQSFRFPCGVRLSLVMSKPRSLRWLTISW